jgi:hypothetical protein
MEPYRLVIEPHPGYVHATAYGERTAANSRRFLEEAYAACLARGVHALLLEVRFTGPSLGVGSIHGVITDRAMDGTALQRIAYVDGTSDDPDKPRFAEMVAMNRGVNVRLFRELQAARAWITEGGGVPR